MDRDRRTRARAAAFAAGVAGIVGGLLVAVLTAGGLTGVAAEQVKAHPSSSATNEFSAGQLQDPASAALPAGIGRPVRVSIPSIDVASRIEDLKVGRDGRLQAPRGYERVGWYADGPAPGEIGPAILAGHVDSTTGPAVFHHLSKLAVGAEIIVTTDTDATLTFRVTGRMQSAKATFPTDSVYSNVPRPELRLITCAGYFDRSAGHYVDNLIVFASLVP